MSYSLAEVQRRFATTLIYESDGEGCDIVSDHFSDKQRIQIYRNNFVIGLSEVMSATYPMVEALVGDECFTQLARQYVLSRPLESADVSEYGEGFNRIIELFPSVLHAAPYLSEVARFEWCCDEVQRSSLCELTLETIQPLTSLPHISPEQHSLLTLHLKDGVGLFDSSYALFSLQQAILNEQLEQLNIHQHECGIITKLENQQMVYQPLDPNAYQLLTAISKESALSEIEPHLLPYLESVISLNIIDGFSINTLQEEENE